MNEDVKKELLSVISETKNALKEADVLKLRAINNKAIQNASVFQDESSLSMAVIIYSLMKIIERSKVDTKKAVVLFDHSGKHLERNKLKAYNSEIKKLLKFISETDRRLKLFIEEVIKQAQIKKGSGLYENGLSLGKAASLLGVSIWDLTSYVGKTSFADIYPSKISEKERLGTARGLFR